MRKRTKTTRTTASVQRQAGTTTVNVQRQAIAALTALTQLAEAARSIAALGMCGRAEEIENTIDVLAPAVGRTVEDVYAPLWR